MKLLLHTYSNGCMCNATQRNAMQSDTAQRHATQRSATQRHATQRHATQRNAAQRSAAQRKQKLVAVLWPVAEAVVTAQVIIVPQLDIPIHFLLDSFMRNPVKSLCNSFQIYN